MILILQYEVLLSLIVFEVARFSKAKTWTFVISYNIPLSKLSSGCWVCLCLKYLIAGLYCK